MGTYLAKRFLPKVFVAVLFSAILISCSDLSRSPSQPTTPAELLQNHIFGLYSYGAGEYKVKFTANYRFVAQLEAVKNWPDSSKYFVEQYDLPATIKFLFGPLTHRLIGAVQKDSSYKVNWSQAKQVGETVEVEYTYEGRWLIANSKFANSFELPLPYNAELILTPAWTKCTDNDHADDIGFLWYFWDPTRAGCDSVAGVQYQTIQVQVLGASEQEKLSYPEYKKMIRNENGTKWLRITLAYGYVEDKDDADPTTDADMGARQYREALRLVRHYLPKAKESAILMNEYLGKESDKRVGSRFMAVSNGIHIEIKVVVNTGIDQMQIFAQSFAHDRDGAFAWFGHSRVGSGFDAANFRKMVENNNEYYKPTSDYQLIYWAGCNSYSYYTQPFFQFKAALNPLDPSGTKGLDIISHGLPSYFYMNGQYTSIYLWALLNFKKPVSYQTLIRLLESKPSTGPLLANVLGDEDNPLP